MIDNYTKSNKSLTVALNKFNGATYRKLLSDKGDREENAQALIDYLCDKFKVPHVRVNIADKPRSQKGNRTIHGFIRVSQNAFNPKDVKSQYINIYNLTAKTHKVVAIKTFANTLIHEFMHHYDYHFLKLTNSLHTAGFYTRISDLEKKLAA